MQRVICVFMTTSYDFFSFHEGPSVIVTINGGTGICPLGALRSTNLYVTMVKSRVFFGDGHPTVNRNPGILIMGI